MISILARFHAIWNTTELFAIFENYQFIKICQTYQQQKGIMRKIARRWVFNDASGTIRVVIEVPHDGHSILAGSGPTFVLPKSKNPH